MTDHYAQCENALVALLLKEMPTYFKHGWQVSDDDTGLSRGEDYFVVVRPSTFPVVPVAGRSIADIQWHVTMTIYCRYTEYSESLKRFKAFRSTILNVVYQNKLRDITNVGGAVIQSKSDVFYHFNTEPKPGMKPNFIGQTLDVTINQRVNFAQ